MQPILLLVLSVFLFPSCDKDDSDIEAEPPTTMRTSIRMLVGNEAFIVSLYDNPTAKALWAMLPITMDMRELNGNEKYYDLPNPLPAAATRPGTIHNGDMMLYGSRTLVLFYEPFSTSYSYTPIGRIDNVAGLKAALGSGSVTITFELKE